MVDLFFEISKCRSRGEAVILVTVTSKEGMAPSDVGKKMIVKEDGSSLGTIGGGSIEYFAIEKAKKLLITRESLNEKYVLSDQDIKVDDGSIKLNMACGGKVDLFYEFVGPKQWVYIFGAGHCGNALGEILATLGFYVTIVDDRKDILDNIKNPDICKIESGFADFFEKYRVAKNRYFVVSTPSHIHDFEVLDKIIEKDLEPEYFGMLCSKKKIVDYLKKIHEKYGEDIDLENFYSPIGLDIGGDDPKEIAISISSEILSIYYRKGALIKHMREKVDKDFKYFK